MLELDDILRAKKKILAKYTIHLEWIEFSLWNWKFYLQHRARVTKPVEIKDMVEITA